MNWVLVFCTWDVYIWPLNELKQTIIWGYNKCLCITKQLLLTQRRVENNGLYVLFDFLCYSKDAGHVVPKNDTNIRILLSSMSIHQNKNQSRSENKNGWSYWGNILWMFCTELRVIFSPLWVYSYTEGWFIVMLSRCPCSISSSLLKDVTTQIQCHL